MVFHAAEDIPVGDIVAGLKHAIISLYALISMKMPFVSVVAIKIEGFSSLGLRRHQRGDAAFRRFFFQIRQVAVWPGLGGNMRHLRRP